jgi:hypothetical protein
MMDTTPIWIDGWYDTHAEAAEAMQTMWRGIKLEGVPTPALTLDQIEEWLKSYRLTLHRGVATDGLMLVVDTQNALVDTMLAQVQAWKEGK